METDDIIYLALLVVTIFLGYIFKQINSTPTKKWISTATGFVIICLVSGAHTLHPVICTLVNSWIIVYLNKRFCHIISFFFTFSYLIIFRTSAYFGIPYAPSHTNLIQMVLTLKVVGLAFEAHDSHTLKQNEATGDKINLSVLDVLHYTFCYIGVLTGPYYSYRTFTDYYENRFHKYAPCESTTIKKLAVLPVYAAAYLFSTYYYPISYVDMDEFYTMRSFWYRLFYIIPVFISFRMRIYIGLILSECVCTMAGLGAYPTLAAAKPGKGPTANIQRLNEFKNDTHLELLTYDFETVKNIDVWYTEFDPTVRSSIRYWNMCVQYWMVYIVYKRFPIKVLRTVATFAVSIIWHGIYAGYFLCLGVVPFYLPIEDIWEDLLRKDATGTKRKTFDILFWIVRTQAFSYMGMAFSLLTMERGLRYYGSVYYVYHFTSLIALVSGLLISKIKRQRAVHIKSN